MLSLSQKQIPNTQKDFILKNFILFSDSGVKKQNLLVKNNKIEKFLDSLELKQYESLHTYNCNGYILAPGFINAHTHVAMNPFRDICHGIDDMIAEIFFKSESALKKDMLKALCAPSIFSSLRSGVSCFFEHYYLIEGIGQAFDDFGVRALLGQVVADQGGAFPSPNSLNESLNLIENWSFSDKVIPCIAPHAVDTVSPKMLQDSFQNASDLKIPLHMHLAQRQGEYDYAKEKLSASPLAWLAANTKISDNCLFAHAIHLEKADFKLLKDSGASVAFCPKSQILFNKLAPFQEFLDAQIPLCLATDCAGSDDRMDLLDEVHFYTLIAEEMRLKLGDEFYPSLLNSLAQNAAKFYGAAPIGKIAPGHQADFVFLANDLSTSPVQKARENLLYSKSSSQVKHVMINGEWILWNQEHKSLNQKTLLEDYQLAHQELKKLASF